MVQVKNLNQYKIGDQVWWFDQYDNLRNGEIFGIKTDTKKGDYAEIREEIGTSGAMLSKCWPTREDCLAAEETRSKQQAIEYAESIKDVNDLVQFLFDHETTGEFREFDAIEAARKRAKDLLGYEIDDGLIRFDEEPTIVERQTAEDDFAQAVANMPIPPSAEADL